MMDIEFNDLMKLSLVQVGNGESVNLDEAFEGLFKEL